MSSNRRGSVNYLNNYYYPTLSL